MPGPTQIAAAAGALAWMAIEGAHHGRATSLGLASGSSSPASG